MTAADLLVELATIDEVSAHIPTGADHDAGIVPPWCELVLNVKREADSDGPGDDGPGTWPINTGSLTLRRHDGELIIEVLQSVLHPAHVSSAVAQVWDELDTVYAKIMRRVERDKEPLKKDVGMALGLATALAIMLDPIEPDVDEVRGLAVERYEATH